MNAYPIGNDLTVKWSLLYSDGSVFPLSNYDYELSYRTNRGNKVVTDTSVISVDENILTWTFKGDEQVVSGRYTICLKITLSGSKVVELQYDNAFMLSPLSGFKGAGSEIVLQSYCDAIDLKDAVLQARKAMDLAGSAVNTAGGAETTANEAKTIASTANNTSTEAKAIAINAKNVADQAKATADATAATATQKAEEVAQKEAQLEAALNNLSTDQSGALALSTKVNEHGEKLSELETAFGKSFNNPTYAYNLFPFKAGETYVVISTGTISVNISTTTDGSIEGIIDGPFLVQAGSVISFKATGDASYIRFSNTFVGYVFRTTELYNLIERNKFSLNTSISQIDTKIDNVDKSLSLQINQKVSQNVGKNLFDKDSPLLKDNSIFEQNGSISSDQYTIYWLISNPIDVRGHQGGKIICNKSYDTETRYACFEDVDGNKITVPTSVAAYTIPINAVTAYIPVYKTNGSINLDEVQIEFGNKSSEYEPYNPIGGYFSEEAKDETTFPPSPQKDMHDTYPSIDTQYIYDIFDAWVAKFPQYVTKTNLGKDASNTYDVNGYKIAFAPNPLFKIMFICNQHGGSANGDPVMGAYIATQLISDICGYGHRHNDRLKWIRNNVEIYIIPAANPWGIDNKRRVNYNGVNLNRNWPTSGWASEPSGQGTDDYKGAAAGDQPELQHYLQFISDVQPDIIIDNHTLGGVDGQADVNSRIMYIGFNKDAVNNQSGYNGFISSLASLMVKEYGITPTAYGHTTDATPDCRTWCMENNIWGGLIEMQWRDPIDGEKGFTSSIIEASYMLYLSIYQYYANVDLN